MRQAGAGRFALGGRMHRSGAFSRRALLVGGAASAGAALVGPGLAEEATTSAPLPPAPDRWDGLSRLTDGALLRPTDARFANEALPNNLRYRHIRPEGIAPCASPQMVADVLRWCRDYDMPFALRGGGHSYGGYSSSRGLVIDLSPMNGIDYDAATGQVRVEAGVLNHEVYAALREAGRMITHGRCPSVGVAGFLLGGGIGFNMRRLGVGCDLLTGAQIVTADGRVRDVSAEKEPELFWALRGGGGGNFGVSTAFTLRTVPADERLTVFRIVWRDRTLDIAKALFTAAEMAPLSFGSRIALGGVTPALVQKGRQVPVTLLGQYAGSQDELMRLLAPVYAVAAPDFADIKQLPYWEGQDFLVEAGEPGWYRERSAFLATAPTAAFLEASFHRLQQWPGTGAQSSLFFFQTGGRINEKAPDETAFVHRQTRWLAVVGANWSEDDNLRPEVTRRAFEWQDDLFATLGGHGGRGAFVNFPDPALGDWRRRYYGTNLDRLMQVKLAVDPSNVFHFQQSL